MNEVRIIRGKENKGFRNKFKAIKTQVHGTPLFWSDFPTRNDLNKKSKWITPYA